MLCRAPYADVAAPRLPRDRPHILGLSRLLLLGFMGRRQLSLLMPSTSVQGSFLPPTIVRRRIGAIPRKHASPGIARSLSSERGSIGSLPRREGLRPCSFSGRAAPAVRASERESSRAVSLGGTRHLCQREEGAGAVARLPRDLREGGVRARSASNDAWGLRASGWRVLLSGWSDRYEGNTMRRRAGPALGLRWLERPLCVCCKRDFRELTLHRAHVKGRQA